MSIHYQITTANILLSHIARGAIKINITARQRMMLILFNRFSIVECNSRRKVTYTFIYM